MKGTRVTSVDLDSGEEESVVIKDDYVVIVDGRRYVDGIQWYKNGTALVTIKLCTGHEFALTSGVCRLCGTPHPQYGPPKENPAT